MKIAFAIVSNPVNHATQQISDVDTGGMLFDIKRFALHDGPGIRTTVFMKGCPLRCTWCHNPESQAAEPEIIFHAARCTGCGSCVEACPHGAIQIAQAVAVTDRNRCRGCGQCIAVCPTSARELVGYRRSVCDLASEIERDVAFFDESGGGVTLSGGEPLFQPEFSTAFLAECQTRRIHTALDTCGFAPWQDLKRVATHADLVLYDLKTLSDSQHQLWTGQSNTLIIDNLARLSTLNRPIWIRIPFIPQLVENTEAWTRLGELIASLDGIEAIHLLPYHRAGESKWTQLERSEFVAHDVPNEQVIATAVEQLAQAAGQAVQIGG